MSADHLSILSVGLELDSPVARRASWGNINHVASAISEHRPYFVVRLGCR